MYFLSDLEYHVFVMQEEKKEEKVEEVKKVEEAKKEEVKEEKKQDDKKVDEEAAPAPPPPPPVIVLRVYMHCEGCARKVRACLKGFPGLLSCFTVSVHVYILIYIFFPYVRFLIKFTEEEMPK